jgi:hypothetical protein
MWDLWYTKSIGTRVFLRALYYFVSNFLPTTHRHLHLHALLIRRTYKRSRGLLRKSNAFTEIPQYWTKYGIDDLVSNSGMGNGFLSCPHSPDGLWDPPRPLFNMSQGSFPGVKRPGLDVDHSPPPSTNVQNEWSYTFTAWRGTTSPFIRQKYFHFFWCYAIV